MAATVRIGTWHLDRGRYAQAANAFRMFALRNPNDKLDAPVLFKAALAYKRQAASDPTFAAKDLRLTESRQLGVEGQHWRARFKAFDSFPVEAVFFDHGQLAGQFQVGDILDTAFRLKRTRWDVYWRLEMELLDVAAAAVAATS